MSNENVNVEVKEEKCNCICHSKWFRKFLVVAIGSFIGVFSALSLFAALNKPPMLAPCPYNCPMMRQAVHHLHHFDKGARGDFHKRMMKEGYDRKVPVRVEVED